MEPSRFALVLTAPVQAFQTDADGIVVPVTQPKGAVVNIIVCDVDETGAVVDYDPGPGLRLVQSDTLNIGDVVA